jgi:hypothetical protein
MLKIEQILTRKQIEQRYNLQWVLLDQVEMDKNNHYVKGRVIYNGKNKELLLDKAKGLNIQKGAFLFIGKHPEERIFI